MFALNNEKNGVTMNHSGGTLRMRQLSRVAGKIRGSVLDTPRLKCLLDIKGDKQTDREF